MSKFKLTKREQRRFATLRDILESLSSDLEERKDLVQEAFDEKGDSWKEGAHGDAASNLIEELEDVIELCNQLSDKVEVLAGEEEGEALIAPGAFDI